MKKLDSNFKWHYKRTGICSESEVRSYILTLAKYKMTSVALSQCSAFEGQTMDHITSVNIQEDLLLNAPPRVEKKKKHTYISMCT